MAASDAFSAARNQLQQTEVCNSELARIIENSEAPFSHTDPDLLILKAISAANTHCLLQCMGLLQRYQDIQDNRSESAF